MNIVILAGRLSSSPRASELPSGTVRWNLELSCPDEQGRLVGVPVSWQGDVPDAWDAGTELVVCGAVRRRFFRSSGSTQSRTEVIAAAVVEVTARRPARQALHRALRAHPDPLAAALRSAAASVAG